MLSHLSYGQIFTWVIAGALLLASPAWAGDDGQPSPGPTVSDEGPDASPRLDVVTATPVQKPMPRVAPVLRRLDGIPGDKGSMFTDRGFGMPAATPTAVEHLKLERARMAIEAARASGVLFSVRRPEVVVPFSQAQRDLEKMHALEAMTRQSRIPAGDPILLPGATAKPLQLYGPAGLTELERRKLEALRNGTEFTEGPARKAEPKEARPVIDEGRKDGKEGR